MSYDVGLRIAVLVLAVGYIPMLAYITWYRMKVYEYLKEIEELVREKE